MATQSELKNFQRSLDEDVEEKRRYVDAEADVTEDEDTEDEEQEAIKIVAPRKPKKKSNVDTMLMEQLIAQQKAYLKAQRAIYKLRTEIDTEEVKTRYIKLDLNNAQVRIGELTAENQITQKKFYKLVVADIAVFFMIFAVLISRLF